MMKNKTLWTVVVIVVLSNLFTLSFILVGRYAPAMETLPTNEALAMGLAPAVPARNQGGGADMLAAQGQSQVLGLDGSVPLFVEPCAPATGESLTVGEQVQLLGKRLVCGQMWYRVRSEAGQEGWLPCSVLAQPDQPCLAEGAILLDGDEALFVAHLSGMTPGMRVQYLLTVNDERYTLPLQVWEEGERGVVQLPLAAFEPRLEPGRWTVQLLIEGQIVGEITIEVAAPSTPGQRVEA